MTDPADRVIEPLLGPEERLLWSGRPNADVLARGTGRSSFIVGILRSVLIAGFGLVAWGLSLGTPLEELPGLVFTLVEGNEAKVFGIAMVLVAVIVLGRWANMRSDRALVRWAESLAYGITDRRLLIVAEDSVEAELTPEEVREPRVRERTQGFADVEFHPGTSRGRTRGETRLQRERRTLAFKALPDAQQVLEIVERWREAHLTASERAVETGGDTTLLQGGRHQLAITAPGTWTAQVRRRKRPWGAMALDLEQWTSPTAVAGWNAAKVDGPFGAEVEVHVDAVASPTLTFEKATDSALGSMLAGEITSSDPAIRRGRFSGWSVTRRHSPTDEERASKLDQPGFMKLTVLHDGAIQLVFLSKWPAASEGLAEAVEDIEGSVTVVSEGAEPVPVPQGMSGVLGFAAGVVTAVRVVFGIFFFGIGAWAGYDQTNRAERYDAGLENLAAAADEGLPTLPTDRIVSDYDGRFAYLQGTLVPGQVTDSLTGLTVEGWRLVRRVDVEGEDETGGQEPTASATASGGVPYRNDVFVSSDLTLGAWRLPAVTWAQSGRRPVPDSLLAQAVDDRWSIRGGALYDSEHPGSRVSYDYHPMATGTYSLIGIPEGGTVDLDGPLAEAPLIVQGSVGPDEIVGPALETRRGVQTFWMVYAWIGLMLLLRPLTKRFELFRGLTNAPFLRRSLMTAGISAAVVLALAVYF